MTAPEIFANQTIRTTLVEEYNELWQEYGLDAILVPSMAHPANPHGKYISNSYSTVYNMLDYTCGCVPVTTVDVELDKATREWYEAKPYPRVEPVRYPYDLGDADMKRLCKFCAC